MFGFWRFFLAMLVVMGHLFSNWWAASYAVFSFYVLSGYLMAFILNETYGFSRAGFGEFWRGRLLRLLPSYWVGCALSLVLIAVVAPDILQAWNRKITLPSSAYEIFSNLTMIGIQHPNATVAADSLVVPDQFSSLVPPAWALSIELFFYLVLSLFFARSAYHGGALLLIGLAYTGWALTSAHPGYYRYYFFMAAAVPFGVGTLVYFALRLPLVQLISRKKSVLLVSFALYVLIFAMAYRTAQLRHDFLYINILTTAALICVLSCVVVPKALRTADRFFGDLAYPVYLLHWQVGLLVFLATGFEKGKPSLFLASIPVIMVFAVVDRQLVSGPIDRWRRKPRKQAAAQSG